jgi:hypothetical protein
MTDLNGCIPSVSDPFVSRASSAVATGGALIRHLVVAALIVLGAGLMAAPVAQAQTSFPRHNPPPEESSPYRGQDRGSDLERLPSWAEPQAPERKRREPNGQGSIATNGFNPPEPPPVPLGGLEWLLAAGLGYGAYRLRGQRDDDAAA